MGMESYQTNKFAVPATSRVYLNVQARGTYSYHCTSKTLNTKTVVWVWRRMESDKNIP